MEASYLQNSQSFHKQSTRPVGTGQQREGKGFYGREEAFVAAVELNHDSFRVQYHSPCLSKYS